MWDIWEAKNDSNRKVSEKKASMNDLPIQLLVRDMVVSITRNEYQEKIFGQKKIILCFL